MPSNQGRALSLSVLKLARRSNATMKVIDAKSSTYARGTRRARYL